MTPMEAISFTYSIATDKLHNTRDELTDSTKENQDTNENIGCCYSSNLNAKYGDQEDSCNREQKDCSYARVVEYL